MGRFKAEQYWYVALLLGLVLIAIGAITLVRNPELAMSADGWWDREETRQHGWMMIGGGGLALAVGISQFFRNATKLRIPDDVRKLQKLERKLRAGEISEAEYAKKRAKIEAESGPPA